MQYLTRHWRKNMIKDIIGSNDKIGILTVTTFFFGNYYISVKFTEVENSTMVT